MNLKVEVETLSSVKRRLAIEVPEDHVAAELERAFSGLSRTAQVRGFRAGRVPRAVLERQFGDRVRSEVFGRLIQESLHEALHDQPFSVAGAPEVVTERAEPGAALRFAATVEVYPEVDVHGYEGLKLERRVRPVTEEDVDRFLRDLQDSLAQLRPVEGRTSLERGDVAIIDYEGRLEGHVVAEGRGRPCEIGRGNYPEGFEARLIGASIGEWVEFPVTHPADDPNTSIAGKTVNFRVHVSAIMEKEVAPLDDEFAKDHGEVATIAELRDRVRAQLQGAALRQADDHLRGTAVAQLAAEHDFELPESLVARQTEEMMVDVAEGWRSRRMWPKNEHEAFAALRQELEPRARGQVKAALLLDAVAAREGIETTEGDVESEIERAAAAAGEAADRVRAAMARPEARRSLQERMRRSRALDLVLKRADITTIESAAEVVAGSGESG